MIDLKCILKDIEKLNQIAKGINDNSLYIVKDGVAYSHSLDSEKKQCSVVRISKIDGSSVLPDIPFDTAVIGSEVYKFFKDNKKKDIVGAEELDNALVIVATDDKLTFKKSDVSAHQLYKTLKKWFSLYNRTKAIDIDITETALSSLERSIPLNIDLAKGLFKDRPCRFRFTKKLVQFRYNDKIEKVTFSYHRMKDRTYITNIQIIKDEFMIEQIYLFIPF